MSSQPNKYISIGNDDNTSSQLVKMTNTGNDFKGTFEGTLKTVQNGTAVDVNTAFLSNVKINGVSGTTKIVNEKTISEVTIQTGDTNTIEKINLNGTEQTPDGSKAVNINAATSVKINDASKTVKPNGEVDLGNVVTGIKIGTEVKRGEVEVVFPESGVQSITFNGTAKYPEAGNTVTLNAITSASIQAGSENKAELDETDKGKLNITYIKGEDNVIEEIYTKIGNGTETKVNPDGKKVVITIPEQTPLTKVFTATDATGTTPVGDLTISPSSHAPQQGDILIVTHTIAAGKDEKSAYVMNDGNWVACSGNVDATKVFIYNDITMAGNYDKIGNFTKSTSGTNKTFMQGNTGTAGVSVYELIRQMLCKSLEPTINAYPTVTLTVTNTSYDEEYGTTVTPTYSVDYADGNYKYPGGTAQNAGCTRQSWTVTNVVDGTAGSGNVKSIVADESSKTIKVTAKASYAAGTNTPKNNLGENSSVAKIPAGTTAEVSETITVTAYRKNFYLVLAPSEVVDLSSAALDGTDAILNSDSIRTNGHGQKDAIRSINDGGNTWHQILVFMPKDIYRNKKLSATTKNGLPYINDPGNECLGGAASPKTITVKGAGDDSGVEYCIWEIKPETPVSGDTISLAWA